MLSAAHRRRHRSPPSLSWQCHLLLPNEDSGEVAQTRYCDDREDPRTCEYVQGDLFQGIDVFGAVEPALLYIAPGLSRKLHKGTGDHISLSAADRARKPAGAVASSRHVEKNARRMWVALTV